MIPVLCQKQIVTAKSVSVKPEKKTEQGNAVDEEYEFTATVKNTNVSTQTNLYRILFIYRVVINFITYFFL